MATIAQLYSSEYLLLTDTRQLTFPEKTIFFAIKGDRHDGHQYIQELVNKGVRNFVVESKNIKPETLQSLSSSPDYQVIRVDSSITALQELAIIHRKQFTLPLIGITGSNGKTIIKEWLSQLLSEKEAVITNPKSYNSQIGVPLSIWNIRPEHTLGIFEAGISKPMEMVNLEPIIRPTIGIFSNIGTAHSEGFVSQKQKTTEKLKLFTRSKSLIYCTDYQVIEEEIQSILLPVNPTLKLFSWSQDEASNATIKVDYTKVPSCIYITGVLGEYVFKLPFTDKASRENITHCIVFLLLHGMEEQAIQEKLLQLKPVSMRLELKEGIMGTYLIDDTYNNDLHGLSIALQFLKKQDQRPQKAIILSDVLQSGQPKEELYSEIDSLLQDAQIDYLIGIGKEISQFASSFSVSKKAFFEDTSALLADFDLSLLTNHMILLKGARSFEFERIIYKLQQKVHKTRLEVNLDALTHNLNYYKSLVQNKTKIMAMVKAFAYGSGSVEIANILQFNKVDYLAVAYPDEGILLRQNGIKLPIMVMNTSPSDFSVLCHYNLEPEIYSRPILESWILFIEKHTGLIPAIHIKLDTGMHRLGFVEDDYQWLAEKLPSSSKINIASIFSHLVGADEGIHNPFSKQQIEKFKVGSSTIEGIVGKSITKHILNSAGIVRFPDYQFDMVRVGIGLYGVEATGQDQKYLETVGSLKTVISQIKEIPAGETIGYSRKGVADHNAKIATIAIGYADGYNRRFGNGNGTVIVNGVPCPTIGNICMDMTMIDVTNAPAKVGDDVEIFGKNNSVIGLADKIGTIPYEIFTGISERVRRVFYKE